MDSCRFLKGTEPCVTEVTAGTRCCNLQSVVKCCTAIAVGGQAMLLMGEPCPTITIDQLVEILTNGARADTSENKIFILDARPIDNFSKEHIIGAKHFERIQLSRDRYETPSMVHARLSHIPVVVCGQKYGGTEVVATLYQRGYNTVLLRGDIEYWKKRYPKGLVTTTDESVVDIASVSAQYAENLKPRIEKSNFLRHTSSSRSKNTTREERERRQSKERRKPWR